MLHPKGRVSDVQRRQMTTVQGAQRLQRGHRRQLRRRPGDGEADVRRHRDDRSLPHQRGQLDQLGPADGAGGLLLRRSIAAWRPRARKVAFSVPTGNFGDVFAGHVAARMGLPIERLIVATNVNDILHRALSAGRLLGRNGYPDRRARRWTSRSAPTSSGCCSMSAAATAWRSPSRCAASRPRRRCASPTPSAKAPPRCSPAPASTPTR